MRIVSFNANGLRSAASKGFFDWFRAQDADVLCLQETKAQEHQLGWRPAFRPDGYRAWFRTPAPRRATAAWRSTAAASPTRSAPSWAGRRSTTKAATSRRVSATSAWCRSTFPSGSSGELRQGFKFEVMDWLKPILDDWLAQRPRLRAVRRLEHRAQRSSTSGTGQSTRRTPAACRPSATGSTACARTTRGWVDAYRALHAEGQDYTWWSNRGAARANNVGWRIDYQFVTPSLRDRLQACSIHPRAAVFRPRAVHRGL